MSLLLGKPPSYDLPDSMKPAQADHDRRHPGLVCRNCPVTLHHERVLEERRDWYEQYYSRRAFVRIVFVLVVLFGCWILSGLIH